MRLILRLLIACSVSSTALAAGDEDLSERQRRWLNRYISAYFDPQADSYGSLSPFESLRPRAATINQLLEEVRYHTNDTSDNGVLTRAAALLSLSARMAKQVDLPLPDFLEPRLRENLRALLLRFPWRGPLREAVLENWDALRLWTPDEFWLFVRMDTRDLNDHIERIKFLLPQLDRERRYQLIQALRDVRPDDLLQYSLLFEMQVLQPHELNTFFRLASIQFALALVRGAPHQDEEFEMVRLIDVRSHVITQTLTQLMKLYQKGDPMIVKAFDRALQQARRSRPPNYRHSDRVWFFKLFQENRLNWTDRSTWRRDAERGDEPARGQAQPTYKVKENIITVNFRRQGKCEDEL